jgi:hypothetical protein
MCISFMDLLEELDVGDPFLVIGDNVLDFDTREGVAVLEVAVGILLESLVSSTLWRGGECYQVDCRSPCSWL